MDHDVCRRILKAHDHYDAVGVPRNADESAIKAGFRKRAREVHPDKNAAPQAAEAFKRLQRAYEILSDPQARRRYDVSGDSEKTSRRPCHQPHYGHSHHYHHTTYEHPTGLNPLLLSALLPVVLSVAMAAVGLLHHDGVGSGGPWDTGARNSGGSRRTSNKKTMHTNTGDDNTVTWLTAKNAEATCGSAAAKPCVVFVAKAGHDLGSKEIDLLKSLQKISRESVRNSRGQALLLNWVVVDGGTGHWQKLLPAGATLPWVLVLKTSRTGLRVAALPVPRGGARQKRRISEGVPELLHGIAEGRPGIFSSGPRGGIQALFRNI